MSKFIVYTDGGARGNPGPAGAGVYITDGKGKELKSTSQFLGMRHTNNVAEYEAVVLAFQTLKKLIPKKNRADVKIEVRMDSELLVEQLSGRYQVKEESLFPPFMKIRNVRITDFLNVRFTHVPREKNKKADKLANEAMDKGE